MNRTAVSAAAMACVAAGAVPSLAAPASVEQGRAASVRMTFARPDGATLSLDIYAATLSAGPQLRIETSRCDENGACSQGTYVSALPAGALTIDSSAAVASLHTDLAGLPLDIRWQPGDGAELGTGYVDGSGTGFTGSNVVGDTANALIGYDGASCTGSGGVGQAVAFEVAPTGSATSAPVDRLHLPDDVTLRC